MELIFILELIRINVIKCHKQILRVNLIIFYNNIYFYLLLIYLKMNIFIYIFINFYNIKVNWRNHDINFDNIISSFVSLFVLSTLEGWPDYLF